MDAPMALLHLDASPDSATFFFFPEALGTVSHQRRGCSKGQFYLDSFTELFGNYKPAVLQPHGP